MPPQGENAALGSGAPGPVPVSGHFAEAPTPSQFTPPFIDAEWREEGNAQAPKPMLNATKLIAGFKQRWRSAVLVGLVLGIIAAVVTWFLVPSKYVAFAYLEVSSEDPQIIPDKNKSSQSDRTYQNTQAQIIKSHPILLKALQRPEVRDLSIVRESSDPTIWIEDEITATYPDNTNLLKVALSGMQPEELAILVNGITLTYMDEHIHSQLTDRRKQWFNLETIIGKTKDEILRQRQRLKELADVLGASDTSLLTAKQKAILEAYASIMKEYTATVSSKWTEEAKLEAAKADFDRVKTTKKVSAEAVEKALEDDYQVKIVAQEVFRAENAATGSKGQIDPDSFLGQQSANRVKGGNEKLEALKDKRRPAVANQVWLKTLSDLDGQIQDHQRKIDSQERQLKKVKVELAKQEVAAEALGSQSAELKIRRTELENTEMTLRTLHERSNNLKVELQSEKHRVSILQPAEPPDHLVRKKQVSGAALAGVCFLFLGMFGITYLDVRERKISTPNDVIQDLGLRVVGVFPSMSDRGRTPHRRKSGIPEGEFWDTILNESIDSIRTMLLRGGEAETPRILMVTSAMPREGKTTLATQLATSIARTGSKTLLIDFDLRHPMVHEIFDVPLEPGLAEVLRGKVQLADAVRTTPLVPGLFILPVGAKARQLVPFLSQGGVPALLNSLRPLYEFIVIDASPVLPVADSLLVGQHVDGVVFSIRPHFSQQPNIEAAYEKMRVMHIRVVGAVVNGVAATLSPNEYRYLSSSTT